jgi:pre-mRNA-processing factor 19
MSKTPSSTLLCALSGQPLLEDAVITPSGRICSKSLLLSKLADNGGSDPFTKQPLDEMQLIALQNDSIIPPRPSATSMPALLKLLNSEYSNLVLELFDARQLLEDTRKELSQSLYQNDAAVRVIARLAMERDAARQELMTWKASAAAAPVAVAAPVAPQEQQPVVEGGDDEPVQKRARTAANAIPAAHVELMTQTWQKLSQARKAEKKQVTANAPTAEILKEFKEVDKKSYHKTRGKQGIVAMGTSSASIVTAGRDKQVCVYNGEQVVQTYSVGECTVTDILEDWVAIGNIDNTVVVLKGEDELFKLTLDQQIVSLHLHPSQQHLIVTTTTGIHIYDMTGEALTFFSSEDEITCAALHPDGLLHAVGTSTGKMCLWDFKSQKLASTLTNSEAPLSSICFSNNGYHLATISDTLAIWDLKKQAVMYNFAGTAATAVTFDPSGKYLAYGGATSVVICAVKEWTPICTLEAKVITNLSWTQEQLISTSVKERMVRFYGSE